MKDDFYYLHFLREGVSTGGSTRFNQEAGGEENAWSIAWIVFSMGKARKGQQVRTS